MTIELQQGSAELLLIFAEHFLSGYNLRADAARLAEPADGRSARRLADIAARHKLSIFYGSQSNTRSRPTALVS